MCVCVYVVRLDIHSVYKWLQNVLIAIYSRVVQHYKDHNEYVFQVRYCGVGISSLTTLSGHTGHRYPNK